ncbi:MAG: hypothetical protein K6A72_00205, partial [Lachnospiraceae bacterium]|nr:hypothetical protein [Lachnospiraceae bacterium]
DNREYKIRLEQISSLAAENDFKKAVRIADRIDWRRVPADMSTLMQISQLYRVSGRSDEAVEMLRLAYKNNKKAKKRPNKKIVYALCDLYLERGDTDNAEKTYRLYKNLDPDSIEKLILQYRLVELCGGSLKSQIDILKQMHNFAPSHPEWRYQLAYLYHRAGATRECVETCDDIVRWFFKGPVVIKALELKMLHERLTPEQQRIFDVRNEAELSKYETDDYSTEYYDDGSGDETEEIQVKLIDQDKFNTVNLSRELAASMAELLAGEEEGKAAVRDRKRRSTTRKIVQPLMDEQDDYPYDDRDGYSEDGYRGEEYADERYDGEGYQDDRYAEEGYDGSGYQDERYPQEAYQDDRYADGQYAEDGYAEDQYADGRYAEEGYGDENYDDRYQDNGYAAEDCQDDGYVNEPYAEDSYQEEGQQGTGGYQDDRYAEAEGPTFFEDRTNELVIDVPPAGLNPGYVAVPVGVAAGAAVAGAAMGEKAVAADAEEESSGEYTGEYADNEVPAEEVQDDAYEGAHDEEPEVIEKPARRSSAVRVLRTSGRYGDSSIFTQGEDGQMNFDMDRALTEKQITGQLTIEEALENWDVRKDSADELIRLDTEKRILDSTGPIFAEFEKQVKESIARHTEPEPPLGVADRIFEDKYSTAGIDLVPLDKYMEEHEDPEKEAVSESEEVRAEDADTYGSDEAGAGDAEAESDNENYDAEAESDNESYEAENANELEDAESGAAYEEEYPADPEESDYEGVSQDTHGTTIWKEVDAALQADREAAKSAEPEPLEEEKTEGVPQDTHGTTIWKEVDAALQAEKAAAEMAETAADAGEAVVETALDAGEAAAETAAAGVLAAGTAGAVTEAAEIGEAAAIGTAAAEMGVAAAEAVTDIADSAADVIEEAVEEKDDEDELSPGARAVAAALADENDDETSAEDTAEAGEYDISEEESDVPETDESDDDDEQAAGDEDSEEYSEEEFSGEDTSGAEDTEEAEFEDEDSDASGSDDNGYDPEEDDNADASLSTGQIDQIGDALENDADRIGVETVEEINDVYDPEDGDPDFSEEEIEIFEHFFYSKKMRDQILVSIDNLSLAPYVGNVIITGGEKEELRGLAKALLRELQLIEGNFREDRVARVSGAKMNKKDVAGVLAQLDNGALLIEGASDLKRETLEKIANVLEKTDTGIVIMLIDEKKAMDAVIREYPMIGGYFNARIDMAPLTDAALVEYAKNYAYCKEYKIDEERAVLALHQRIDELQIGEHIVSLAEIEEIVDEAIYRSSHHLVSTFLEILSGKRYDKEDAMIILRERDFQGRRGGAA